MTSVGEQGTMLTKAMLDYFEREVWIPFRDRPSSVEAEFDMGAHARLCTKLCANMTGMGQAIMDAAHAWVEHRSVEVERLIYENKPLPAPDSKPERELGYDLRDNPNLQWVKEFPTASPSALERDVLGDPRIGIGPDSPIYPSPSAEQERVETIRKNIEAKTGDVEVPVTGPSACVSPSSAADALSQCRSETKQAWAEYESVTSALRSELAECQGALKEREWICDREYKANATLRAELDTTKSLHVDISSLNACIAHLEAERNALRAELEACRGGVIHWKECWGIGTDALQRANATIAAQQAELASLRARVEQLEALIRKAEKLTPNWTFRKELRAALSPEAETK